MEQTIHATPTEHRASVLGKTSNILACVYENVMMQPESPARASLALFISDIGSLVELMEDSKNDEAFGKVTVFIHDLLHENLFSKLAKNNK